MAADGPPETGSGDATQPGEASGTSPAADARSVEPGRRIGRYVVLAPLGRGAMGVVVSAWDPTLDRKVAIKLLRHGSGDGTDRLLREAQALARLAHVNVVSVFDVGIADGQAFVAMEFVAGTTLARWVAAGRPWRERLRVLLDAGRGLAAVHDAGLVHRDVKPDNVMIDEQGRVRLMDLGLATPSTATAADPAVPGALAGTPAYMAPEQFLGASATRARISSPGA